MEESVTACGLDITIAGEKMPSDVELGGINPSGSSPGQPNNSSNQPGVPRLLQL